jgi:polygalacturonase
MPKLTNLPSYDGDRLDGTEEIAVEETDEPQTEKITVQQLFDLASSSQRQHASEFSGADGGAKIQSAINEANSSAGPNVVVVGPIGPDDVSGSSGSIGNTTLAQNAWELSSPIELPDDTLLLLQQCYLYAGDGMDNNMIRNVEATDTQGGSGSRNKNIAVVGQGLPILDGNGDNQTIQNPRETNPAHLNIPVRFMRVDNLLITGIEGRNPPGWNVKPELCTEVTMTDIRFNHEKGSTIPNRDGVHPSACENVHIENIEGNTGDDTVAINANDSDNFTEVGGPLRDVTIDNVTGLCTNNVVRVYGTNGETEHPIERIQISNILTEIDTANSIVPNAALQFSAYSSTFEHITINNIQATNTAKGLYINEDVKHVSITNISVEQGIGLDITSRFQRGTVSNISCGGSPIAVSLPSGQFWQSSIRGISGNAGQAVVVPSGASIQRGKISNITLFQTSSNPLIDLQAGADKFVIKDVLSASNSTVLNVASGASVALQNFDVDEGGTVYGGTPDSVELRGDMPPADVTRFPTIEGARAYNDGTTGTVGPAFSDGTNWISLVDGSTI